MNCKKCGKELIYIIKVSDNRIGKGSIKYIDCKCDK